MAKEKLLHAVSSKNETTITTCMHDLEKHKNSAENRAYLGVMYTKYAQFKFFPTDKFSYFNKGKSLLEKEIESDPSNVEFRFLRLIIQENAPGIVMYSDNISTDAKRIKEGVNKLSDPLKEFILAYAKTSKALKKAGM